MSKQKAHIVAKRLMNISTKEKATQIALRSIKESLGDAVQGLQDDALEKYSQSAVLLKMNVEEERFLINYKKKGSFYLPEIMLGKKRYLVSSLDMLSGMRRIIKKSSRISKLNYTISKPKDAKDETKIKNPILSLDADNRVCLLEVPAIRKGFIDILTYSFLRKRGLQSLILFKCKSFGEASSNLDGRCSLGLKKGDNYLYIRNSARKNSLELKAEVGDFIMTRQGMFVGLAVDVEYSAVNRQQRIKCFVFSDDFNIKDSIKISLEKAAKDEYYRPFAEAVEKVNKRLKDLDRKRKL
jgi:hypothetical protein